MSNNNLNYRCYDIDNCQECLYKHQLHIKENEKAWFVIASYISLSGICVFFIVLYSSI